MYEKRQQQKKNNLQFNSDKKQKLEESTQENEQNNMPSQMPQPSQSETYKEIEPITTLDDNRTTSFDDDNMNETTPDDVNMENNDKDFIYIIKQTAFIAVTPLAMSDPQNNLSGRPSSNVCIHSFY
ncbi:24425_t:CDS:2 [Entrophospora sp. SA101]|nr:24425_t:CDS:2 [Entrophospora sp. SA101]